MELNPPHIRGARFAGVDLGYMMRLVRKELAAGDFTETSQGRRAESARRHGPRLSAAGRFRRKARRSHCLGKPTATGTAGDADRSIFPLASGAFIIITGIMIRAC